MATITKGNKMIIMSEDKQKELYEIIASVFQTELKTQNCFVLPLVHVRAGHLMQERCFGKANKNTFLSAPLYFKVGFNQKDADAISLVDYPADSNFSVKRSYEHVIRPIQLTPERQQQLVAIVVETFNNISDGRQVFLSDVGQYAGKKLEEAGFGRATAALFRKAEDYFDLDWNGEKNAYLLSLKGESDRLKTKGNITYEIDRTQWIKKLKELYSEKKYTEILSTVEFLKIPPDKLGKDNILLLLRTVAAFFNDDSDIYFNEFQCKLIEAKHAADLKNFLNDKLLLTQGVETSTAATTLVVFEKYFRSVCNGKNNLNNSWRSLTERFWGVKNELAFYFNVLWLLSLKNEEPIKFFISQSIEERKIARIVSLIDIWMTHCNNTSQTITVELKRNIMGKCLYCNDIDTLCKCLAAFDNKTMPEAKKLQVYLLNNEEISSNELISYFHSDVGETLAEHLTNYFWYKQWNATEILPEPMINVLSAVLYDYMMTYVDSIIKDEFFEDFKTERKAAILVKSFPYLCQLVKTNNNTYLLLNYIYVNLLDLDTSAQFFILPRENYDEMWKDTTVWLAGQVKQQFTKELSTTQPINYFKYNHLIKNKLEKYYCETYIKPQFDECPNKEALNSLKTLYEASGITFVTQWVKDYSHITGDNIERSVGDILFAEKKFAEAILWIKKQKTHDTEKMYALLQKAICDNFNYYGVFKNNSLNKKAISIYNELAPEVAEAVLLYSRQLSEDVIRSLFATYMYQENWLKVAYMYGPYSSIRKGTQTVFYANIEDYVKTKGINLIDNKGRLIKNHFDIIKVALQVLNNHEFDDFINWAQHIPVPYESNGYKIINKSFDPVFKEMLTKKVNKNNCWDKLIWWVLRTDYAEQQDNLRYSIITAYIGRFGYKRFEELLNKVSTSIKSAGKSYYAYYASIWKGVLTGKYSCNILSLNLPLIKDAPLTYWHLFYDVAVCKNHVFTLNSLYYENWNNTTYDVVQSFYDALVERYAESRETVFLQLSLKLLEQYTGTVNAHFESYFPYTNSNKDKDFLFQTIITLLKRRSYLTEIAKFLKADAWILTEKERNLSASLQVLCESNIEVFNKTNGLNLNEYSFEKFRVDFLNIFERYPVIDIVNTVQNIQGRGDTKLYQYALIKQAFQIVDDDSQFKELQKRRLLRIPCKNEKEYAELLYSYLGIMDLCYTKQLQHATGSKSYFNERIRIQNRYHRLLAGRLLLAKDYKLYSDDDILALMQDNKHFSDIFNNYNSFKISLLSFLKNDEISDELKQQLLLSVVANKWEGFVVNIDNYDIESLNCVHNMMEHTNYRDLNIQLLFSFLVQKQAGVNGQIIKKVKACSPDVGDVVEQFIEMEQKSPNQYEEALAILINLCRLQDPENHQKTYYTLTRCLYNINPDDKKKLQMKLFNKYWNFYMAALWSTSYESTIIGEFGRETRRINCDKNKIVSWKPVLANVSKLGVYYYLRSLWHAIRGNRKEAKEEYDQITTNGKDDIPAQWKEERNSLEAYILDQSKTFELDSDTNISELRREEETKNVDFIKTAVEGINADHSTALSAYERILKSDGNSDPAEVLVSFKQLFAFCNKPQEVNALYRELDTRWRGADRISENNNDDNKNVKRTYNELVITFGSLLIIKEEIFKVEQKYNILKNIIDIYGLLSDANKDKVPIKQLLKKAQSCVFEKLGLNLNVWLTDFERIKEIIQHPAIGNPDNIILGFIQNINSCKESIVNCDTQMKRLMCLTEWRKEQNISTTCSDYERSFIAAVDDEIERLNHGANLQLEVLNETVEDYRIIENDRIFYQVENVNGNDNVTISLNNTSDENSGCLKVLIGINGQPATDYENEGFSNIVELRPGDLCGQEYKLHSSILSKIKPGDVLEIILNIVVNGEIICNNDKKLFKYEGDYGVLVPEFLTTNNDYKYAVPAFSEYINGFGRKEEIETIRERLKSNLLIIYGASRIGKSSLLNYINNIYLKKGEYFEEKDEHDNLINKEKAVISILIAGTENPQDYEVSMLDGSASIMNYDNNQMWEYLFTAPLLKVFNTREQDSRCEYFGNNFPEAVREKIKSILAETNDTYGKYKAISKVLVENHCEIWLLYDEFQQTIERLVGTATRLGTFCSNIIYSLKGFKLVLCGSDDLLRLFECESDVNWNDFIRKTGSNTKKIKPLIYDDFVEMIMDHDIWGAATNPFVEEALKLLHRYTGGNAICGKIFGNVILTKLRKGDYKERKKIYPSDITQIAYNLLKSENGLIKNLLIAHTTKNLDNEKKYLWFIANELIENPNQSMVPYSKIKEFFVTRTEEIDLALNILEARNILEHNEEKNSYGFTTMFYYDFYRNEVTEDLISKLEKEERPKQGSRTVKRDPEKAVRQEFSKLDNKGEVLHALYSRLTADEKKEFRESFGEQHFGDKFSGDKIGGDKVGRDKNSVIINAQTINTAFNTLLSPGGEPAQLIDAFKHLPTLSAYIGEEQQKQIEMRKQDIEKDYAEYENCNNEELSTEIAMRIAKKEDEIEQITAEPKQKMLNDTIGGAVSTLGTDAFMNVDEEKWKELLHISSNKKVRELMSLPVEFSTPLTFAVVLHNIFENIYKKVEAKENEQDFKSKDFSSLKLDFCPVAIMYCKVIEAMLKRKHTAVYVNALGKKTVKQNGILFEALKTNNGIDTENKDLTIGSFVSHLVYLDKKKYNLGSPNNEETMIKPKETDFYFGIKSFRAIIENYEENIKKLIEQSDGEPDDDELLDKWKTHARCLKIIELIRNRSAHEAVPITKDNFDWLIEILFRKNEMIRVWKELIGSVITE